MPSTELPLSEITVIDLSRAAAGPYCTMMLGDMGADIIKIERPDVGDELRNWDEHVEAGMSTYFLGLNRNKRSIEVDLNTSAGQEVVRTLCEDADVFVENFRPGVTRKWGFDYESLAEVNPSLVYCSITGFGEEGTLSDRPGMDLIAQAYTGIMGTTGEPDGPPIKTGPPISDLGTAIQAAYAILLALYQRERTGQGQKVEISLFAASLALLANHTSGVLTAGKQVPKSGSGHPLLVPYQAFRGKDGEYFVVGILNEKFWGGLCSVLGREDLLEDERFRTNATRVDHRDELVTLLQSEFDTKSAEAWLEILERKDIPCAPILDLNESLAHEQTAQLGLVEELEIESGETIKALGPPFKLSNTKTMKRTPPPTLGEHTEEILEQAGYDSDTVDEITGNQNDTD